MRMGGKICSPNKLKSTYPNSILSEEKQLENVQEIIVTTNT